MNYAPAPVIKEWLKWQNRPKIIIILPIHGYI